MNLSGLLYKKECRINDHIKVMIPTVGEILDQEEEYYGAVMSITAMPIDMMVQLDDIGIDFTKINEWDLFVMTFGVLKEKDLSLIFGDMDMTGFEMAVNPQNNEMALVDRKTGTVIDRSVHWQIASALRAIHHLKRNISTPGNEAARKYMIRRARERMKRKSGKESGESELENLIIALVNTEQYHYGFEGTRELSIYQFNESVQQVIKKVNYDNMMHGVYAGTINAKDLNQNDLNWLSRK